MMMMTCRAAADATWRCGEGEHLLTTTAGCNYQYYRNQQKHHGKRLDRIPMLKQMKNWTEDFDSFLFTRILFPLKLFRYSTHLPFYSKSNVDATYYYCGQCQEILVVVEYGRYTISTSFVRGFTNLFI
jgi:hypothetical protein